MFGLLNRDAIKRLPYAMTTERLLVRPPLPSDYDEWVRVRSHNRDYLQPWEPTWPDNFADKTYFTRKVERHRSEWNNDDAYAFLIFRRDDDALIGGININNIARGAAQFGTLGYWLAQDAQGHGYMREAATAVIRYGFDTLNLHRLHIACLPDNARSIKLAKSLGFVEEGFAKSYVKINGTWHNHVLFGLVKPE